jgi:hypothetical protein
MEIARGYGPMTRKEDEAEWEARSLLRSPFEATLVLLVRIHQTNAGEPGYFDDPLYRVTFQEASAFRVLDEGGLSEFWHQTKPLGGRPGQTTFRVRNHDWFSESLLPWNHFEFLSLGYGAYLAFYDRCRERFPDIGKAVQAVEVDVAAQPSIDFSMYSREDLQAMRAILEKYGAAARQVV